MSGDDITHESIPARVQRGLVRTFQTTRLFQTLTVADNVALAIMQRRGITRRFFSRATERPDVRAEWCDILARVGLDALAYRPVSELAYGQQRLIELAIGIALKPKLDRRARHPEIRPCAGRSPGRRGDTLAPHVIPARTSATSSLKRRSEAISP
eukprot:gene40767-55110_t